MIGLPGINISYSRCKCLNLVELMKNDRLNAFIERKYIFTHKTINTGKLELSPYCLDMFKFQY